jgi:hypothetical protein
MLSSGLAGIRRGRIDFDAGTSALKCTWPAVSHAPNTPARDSVIDMLVIGQDAIVQGSTDVASTRTSG